jgi:hypothetical protein
MGLVRSDDRQRRLSTKIMLIDFESAEDRNPSNSSSSDHKDPSNTSPSDRKARTVRYNLS